MDSLPLNSDIIYGCSLMTLVLPVPLISRYYRQVSAKELQTFTFKLLRQSAVVEFHRNSGKSQEFLYPNQHHQKIFWYPVRLFDAGLSKFGHLHKLKSILNVKYWNMPNFVSSVSKSVARYHLRISTVPLVNKYCRIRISLREQNLS